MENMCKLTYNDSTFCTIFSTTSIETAELWLFQMQIYSIKFDSAVLCNSDLQGHFRPMIGAIDGTGMYMVSI